jgi:hypothetical protein
MRQTLLLAAGFLMLWSGVSSGQTVSAPLKLQVLLLHYKTGRPLKGCWVELALSNPVGKLLPRPELMRSVTDAKGVATFRFDKVPPPRIWVIAMNDYECSERHDFATTEVFERGIAGTYADDDRCKPHALRLPNPQPGEVVFPVHRLNLWQRIVRTYE